MRDRERLESIAEKLRYREGDWKEYDVIEDGQEGTVDDDFMPSWIYDREYDRGLKVKKKYMDLYREVRLEDAIKGRVVSGDSGECYLIESSSDFKLCKIGREIARQGLLSNLRLLRGIGPEKEVRLKLEGYRSIEDLTGHPRWSADARRFVEIVDSCDICRIQDELWHWLPKSDPLNLHLSAFTNVDRFVALDIETLGLFSRPIILFGAAIVDGDKIKVLQYLARDVNEEAAAIEHFCGLLEDRPLLSYNGRSFDVPYINQRRWFYDLGTEINNIHFDMLHFTRRALKGYVPDARLKTVEKYLFGHERYDDVPGALVPEFYEDYIKTGNPGPLVPIVEHNRQDIITLARLFSKLCEDEHGNGKN